MVRRRFVPSSLLLLAFLLLATPACSGIAPLDAGGGEATTPLTGQEAEAVRTQAEKALAEQRFKTAWNTEVEAGADRARLEHVALEALAAQSAHTEDMFAALRVKHGALSTAARDRVSRLVAEARAQQHWGRALAIEVTTADDPPTYARAWALYRQAPADRAAGLLASLRAAKTATATAREKGD